MYYVSKAPNGSAMIHMAPPAGKDYFAVEELPAGEGRLMIGPENTLYREPLPAPAESEADSLAALREQVAAQQAVINALLGEE